MVKQCIQTWSYSAANLTFTDAQYWLANGKDNDYHHQRCWFSSSDNVKRLDADSDRSKSITDDGWYQSRHDQAFRSGDILRTHQ